MSSGMNVEQAKEYAKTMTYSEAVSNVKSGKGTQGSAESVRLIWVANIQ